MDGWKKYKGKKVFIKLKNGREYSGRVSNVSDGWIAFEDKFKQNVKVKIDEISVIEEENNR